ncbi:hypothetical protein N7541_005290 [Penicillium brevicompactum]|uniref:Uncharacterized protein n=1 Tax=Penicillium brevicompactum TaxID=5074 RepID=A0A9W9RD80_PENBR|nr:hypothetical protein N7541_005290 [Penicillium brevicompactum]
MPPKRRPSGSDRSSDDENVFIPPERTMNAAQYAATARGSSTPATARADRATRAALLSTSNDKMSPPASNRAPVISPRVAQYTCHQRRSHRACACGNGQFCSYHPKSSTPCQQH